MLVCTLFWRCDDTISHVPCIEVESERVGEGEFEGMREHVNETDGKLSSQPPLHTAHTHTLAKSAVSSSTASKQQVILWNWTFCVGQMYRESNLFFYICPVVCHCVCVCRCLFAHNFVVAVAAVVVVVSLSLIIVELSHSHISFWVHHFHWRESFYLSPANETKQSHFFVVLKLFRWHSTARSFIWSHALTVSPGLKHLLISLFVVSHIECANTNRKKARASRYLQAHSFTTLQKKTKEVCYLRRELNWMRLSFEIVASTFYSIDTLSVSIFYASLFWNEWVCVLEAAIQFRETSMKLLTAPFIFTSICRHRQIGINWFRNRNTWCWSCCCCYF